MQHLFEDSEEKVVSGRWTEEDQNSKYHQIGGELTFSLFLLVSLDQNAVQPHNWKWHWGPKRRIPGESL